MWSCKIENFQHLHVIISDSFNDLNCAVLKFELCRQERDPVYGTAICSADTLSWTNVHSQVNQKWSLSDVTCACVTWKVNVGIIKNSILTCVHL